MSIILQIILGLLISFIIIVIYNVFEYILFFVLNRKAYKEYYEVADDVKNNRIPDSHSAFIEYNQKLKYVSVRSTFNLNFIEDKNKIYSKYYIVPPYSSFCEERSRCDILGRFFECNIFNWRK